MACRLGFLISRLRVHSIIKKCPWELYLGKKMDWAEGEAIMQAH